MNHEAIPTWVLCKKYTSMYYKTAQIPDLIEAEQGTKQNKPYHNKSHQQDELCYPAS